MLKETLTYTDYEGNKRTEDFYFNLSKAEVLEMELQTAGGMEKMLKTIIDSKDTQRIVEVFKGIICRAYGVKSPDGRKFMKSEEILRDFTETEAYSDLFFRLASDAEYASNFIRGILPAMETTTSAVDDSNASVQVK